MRTAFTAILLMTLNQTVHSQTGKYFGSEYACTVESAINMYYWLDLKVDKTFEYSMFCIDEELDCQKSQGTWSSSNDTLWLRESETKVYFYLFSGDTLKSPNQDIFRKIMTGRNNEILNKGIDDFGLGITIMVKLDALLSRVKDLTREVIIRWSNKPCRKE